MKRQLVIHPTRSRKPHRITLDSLVCFTVTAGLIVFILWLVSLVIAYIQHNP